MVRSFWSGLWRFVCIGLWMLGMYIFHFALITDPYGRIFGLGLTLFAMNELFEPRRKVN